MVAVSFLSGQFTGTEVKCRKDVLEKDETEKDPLNSDRIAGFSQVC